MGKRKKHPILGGILVLLGIIIIIGALGGGGSKNTPTKVTDTSGETVSEGAETSEQEEVRTEFGLGEKVTLNDVAVTLLNVSESKGSAYNKPTDGNVFVLCEFEIENNKSSDINVSSMLSFECYCDDYTSTLSIGALMEKGNKNQLDGTVASGKKFNGVVGYEVPVDWQELELHFTPGFWSVKDIVFTVTHEEL